MEGEEGGRSGVVGKNRNKTKLIRKKEESPCYVFGVDILIDEVMEATETIIIGRVRGRKYSVNYIKDWTTSVWVDAPGSPRNIQTLAQGWFMIKFEKKEHLEWVIERNWNFEKRHVFFRKWTPLFDA